jgi:hypothetical protein
MRRTLTAPELRHQTTPRRPIPVVDGVKYNIGAIFRLCDACLVQVETGRSEEMANVALAGSRAI